MTGPTLSTLKELEVSAGEEQEHVVSGFELPYSSEIVRHAAMLSLGHLQVLPYNRHDPLSIWACMSFMYSMRDMSDDGCSSQVSLAPWSSAKQEIEWGEPSGCLGSLPNGKEDIGQE